jgi:putative serine protease PepD
MAVDPKEPTMNDDMFWAGGEASAHPTEPLPPPPPPPAPPTVRSGIRTAVAATATAALVAGAAGVAAGVAIERHGGGLGSDSASGSFNVAPTSDATAKEDPKSYAGVAARVLPSVVSINVVGPNEQDTGSGVILTSNGYVLTNNHVVAAAAHAGKVSVLFNDASAAPATIVGTDPEDDLAVIKVDKSGLPAATLGSSSAVQVGDPVLAVGSPLGLTGTVTAGIVSALDRPVNTTADQQNTNPFTPFGGARAVAPTVINAIQTDAPINPGNSGGPLVDASGAVIGINSAIASTGSALGGQAGNIGVGFAIPIDQAKQIAHELITSGHVQHPILGVSLADATDKSGNLLARVEAVVSGGPADQAGLQVGDVVTTVGGQPTSGADAVIAAIRTHQPGDRVLVAVERGGVRKTLTVTLGDANATAG